MITKNFKIISPPDFGGVLNYSNRINSLLIKKGHRSELILLKKSNANILKKIRKNDIVIFQYEAYAYNKKGAPLWLLKEFKNIKKKTKNIIIFFHEIFADYKVWHPYFVISQIQKYICKELVKISNFWITSNLVYRNWLIKNTIVKKNFLGHAVSTINRTKKTLKKNSKILVIFGTEQSRIRVYKNNFEYIKNWINKEKLKVFDIGPKIRNNEIIHSLNNSIIKIKGKLTSKEVEKFFLKADYGLFSTEDRLVEKGGIFSTYCDFGIIPINTYYLNKQRINKYKSKWFNYLPNLNISRTRIKRIRKSILNYRKKLSINNHVEIYLNEIV